MKILIVDDNAKMRRVIKTLVADQADEFCECADGETACAAYAEYQPDFVLMDLAMGQVDGLIATRQIIDANPAARIIIVTNYDDKHLRAAAQASGACGYVLKENLLELSALLLRLASDPGPASDPGRQV